MLTINFARHAIRFPMSLEQHLINKKETQPDRRRAGAALRHAYFEAKDKKIITNQEELADLMGFSRSFISQFFSGERAVPFSKIHRLAALLKCNAFDIADDAVRKQLREESERTVKLTTVKDYFVVTEAGVIGDSVSSNSNFGAMVSPIQLRMDLIENEGMSVNDVRIVRIDNETHSQMSVFQSVIVRTDRLDPLESGGIYAMHYNNANVVKRITTQDNGIVIEATSAHDNEPPRFLTNEELTHKGVSILGLVMWTFGRVS